MFSFLDTNKVASCLGGRRIDEKNDDGYTPFIQAAMEGNYGCVVVLLQSRTENDPGGRTYAGSTALYWSEWKDHPGVSKYIRGKHKNSLSMTPQLNPFK